jgi:tRNA(Arg) A34 adenosine deaminase TadA
MRAAIELAENAAKADEVPVGAVGGKRRQKLLP